MKIFANVYIAQINNLFIIQFAYIPFVQSVNSFFH